MSDHLTKYERGALGQDIARSHATAAAYGQDPSTTTAYLTLEALTKLYNEMLDARRLVSLLWKYPPMALKPDEAPHYEAVSTSREDAALNWVLDHRHEAVEVHALLRDVLADESTGVPS